MNKLNVLVFGAGAIGTYVGGSLVFGGQHVVFLERPQAAEELRGRDLRLEIPNEKSSPFNLPAISFKVAGSLTEALSHGPFDIAIYALKSFDTGAALEQIKPYAEDLPPVLCLSNGVENEAVLATVLGNDKVIAGTVTSSITRRGVGEVVLEKLRGIGVADGHPLSLWLLEALNEAFLNARMYQRPADMKWSKMLTNLMVNASVAILNMPPGEVLSNPRLFGLEIAMLREALAVMKAQNIHVVDTPRTPVRLLAAATRMPSFIARPLMVKAVGNGRGAKMPSLHIDLYGGRGKSEVGWLNGAVVRFGKKYGVPTPVNHKLTEILSALTSGEIPLAEYCRQPEKLLGDTELYP